MYGFVGGCVRQSKKQTKTSSRVCVYDERVIEAAAAGMARHDSWQSFPEIHFSPIACTTIRWQLIVIDSTASVSKGCCLRSVVVLISCARTCVYGVCRRAIVSTTTPNETPCPSTFLCDNIFYEPTDPKNRTLYVKGFDCLARTE